MKKLFVLAALAAFGWAWHQGKLPWSSSPGAFGSDGKPVVWIFTFPDCGGLCLTQLAELKRRRVPFEEKQLSPDQPETDDYRLWESFGKPSFPFIAAGTQRFSSDSRTELVSLLANTFGDQYLSSGEARYFKQHFNDDGSARIVLYGTSWCGICAALRKELAGEAIAYLDIDVEADPRGDNMIRVLGIGGYPAVWVGYTRVNGTRLRDVLAVKG